MEQLIKVSVRNLVEFILCSGDIDNSRGGIPDAKACQEGSRIHKKIQKSKGIEYTAEVPLKITVPMESEEDLLALLIEGRADGIIDGGEGNTPRYTIDEIKSMYADPEYIKNPFAVHLAQAKCYAYIWAKEKNESSMGIQITYCNIETEQCKFFLENISFGELEKWFLELIKEYSKWAHFEHQWNRKRNASIKELEFPFSYREGQKDLVAGVYRSILREKKLYIEAPTGVGKTISTVFPAVKAMGEGLAEKIFYLTAKTITRTVAEEAFSILTREEGFLKTITLTAKEKICIFDKCQCTPGSCHRAKGHYDRVNDAVFDLLNHENQIDRDRIETYAKKHRVCPFEMSLDTATWVDAVICDYNYVFDPNAHLKRFFAYEKKRDYVFLIDEAHNLVERAREMYSADLIKKEFLQVKKLVKPYSKKLEKALEVSNRDLLYLRREYEEGESIGDIESFSYHLLHLTSIFEEFFQNIINIEEKEKIQELYFKVRNFLAIYEEIDFRYRIFAEYNSEDSFFISLKCMDPSEHLKGYLEKGRSAVFFSATLLPIHYYKEQLSGEDGDYAIYAPSPFDTNQRLIMIGTDVSTRFQRRNEEEYRKIAKYITSFSEARKGNYFVFFPSYQLLNQVYNFLEANENRIIHIQKQRMEEKEREEFLSYFNEDSHVTQIGFCVMGGIFGEGIDLKNDRLIGAVIVGTGLPMISKERELLREYYQERSSSGFEYAYLYNGMNKVLQSAGRVIRTKEDKGAILLLDERFMNSQYLNLFPREWNPYERVTIGNMRNRLDKFWEGSVY